MPTAGPSSGTGDAARATGPAPRSQAAGEVTPADVLDAAADLLDRDGWCQGYDKDDDGRYCARGATKAAASSDTLVGAGARIALTQRLPTHNIPAWNDTPGRTQEEVTSTLRRVARELREEG